MKNTQKNNNFKIKQFFKENLKVILAIIITTILVGGTTAFATYNYFAKDIEYEKSDGTKISVESALNELYKKEKLENVTLSYALRRYTDGAQSSAQIYVKNFKKVIFSNEGGSTYGHRTLRIIYNNNVYSIKQFDSITIEVVDDNNIMEYDTTGTEAGFFVGGHIKLIANDE